MIVEKKKKKHSAPLTVDFVTVYSVDECRNRLASHKLARSPYRFSPYRVKANINTKGHLSVFWKPQSRYGTALHFTGQLDPVPGGTHVYGSVTVGTRRTLKLQHTITVIIVVGIILFIVYTLFASAIGDRNLSLLVLGVISIALLINDYTRQGEMKQIAPWIRRQLYKP